MRSICLYFQVHQPYRLRTYRFFNIGDDHHYYDDYQNRSIIRRVADKCYLPANKMMMDLIKEYGTAFKVSFSISGTAIDQLQAYAPEVIDSFRQLARTGCVEFLAETYSHSLASMTNKDEFFRQIDQHTDAIENLFGQRPVTFRNTELIYSDGIGEMAAEKGFTTMMTEGAKNILGWKSPNYMYCNAINPKLKLLLRNFRLSDDIAFRFSSQAWPEWPLTAEKFTGWLNAIDAKEEVVNVFIDYETIGERQWKETGIFDFFRSLPKTVFSQSNFTFSTPRELTDKLQPIAPLHVPYPISWADEERDLTSWLGNELQDEAFLKLFSSWDKVKECKDPDLIRDWGRLQTSDHFYYMCTKWFSDGAVHKYFNPYSSPYEAFINYMNVLSDFIIRLDEPIEIPGDVTSGKKALKESSQQKSAPNPKPLKTRTGKLVIEAPVIIEKKDAQKEKNKAAWAAGRSEKTSRDKVKEEPFKTLDFNDIVGLSDKKIKEIIKKLDIETVSYAMKGADIKVREKVEKNLGKKALAAYQELLKQLKHITTADVKKYRKEIIKHITQ
jgi:alpha-amylase